MRAIVIEDEKHNRKLLEGMIGKIRPEYKIVAQLESVAESVDWLKNNDAPDVVFMDIQLSDGLCFSIFEEVNIESFVIFTTAYDEYAIQAFQVNSVDYLLKPIDEQKLANALDKFEKLFSLNKEDRTVETDYDELVKAIRSKTKSYKKRFIITRANSFYTLNTIDIACFYTENRITYAITYEGKELHLDTTMEKLDEELDPDVFFRANRSTIVNIDAIQKFENNLGGKLTIKLKIPYKEEIKVSRLKAAHFKSWIDK